MASNDIFYALEEILDFLTSAEMTLDTLLSLIGMILSLGQLVISVVGWGVAIISAVMSVVLGIVLFIVKAIPVFALAKKNGRKLAWLAWIPFFTDYLQTFVLMDTPGNAPFKLFKGKLNLEKRWIAFCIWLGICLLGGSIVSALNTAISSVLVAIPVLGPAVAVLVRLVLGYVVVAAAGIMEFGFLRDVLNVYNADKKNNQTVSVVIIVLDALVTGGWAKTIWLYLQLKKKPLPVQEAEAEVVA